MKHPDRHHMLDLHRRGMSLDDLATKHGLTVEETREALYEAIDEMAAQLDAAGL